MTELTQEELNNFNTEDYELMLLKASLKSKTRYEIIALLDPAVFQNATIRTAVQVLRGLWEQQEEITKETLLTAISDRLPDPDYFKVVIDKALASSDIKSPESYIKRLKDVHTRKNILKHMDSIAEHVFDMTVPVEEIIASMPLQAEDNSLQDTYDLFDLLEEEDRQFKARLTGADSDFVIPFSLRELNWMTNGGKRKGLMYAYAGAPSMGKSSLMYCQILHSILLGYLVYVVSLEIPAEELIQNLLSILSGVPLDKIQMPKLLNEEEKRLRYEATKKLAKVRHLLKIAKPHVKTVEQIRKEVLLLKPDEVYIDYLQRVKSVIDFKGNRYALVTHVSAELADIGREYNTVMNVVAQLKRIGDRSDKRPYLDDLRESGQIEQDLSVCIMLYRGDYYLLDAEADKKQTLSEVEFLFRKNRNGETGVQKGMFMKNIKTFFSINEQETEAYFN